MTATIGARALMNCHRSVHVFQFSLFYFGWVLTALCVHKLFFFVFFSFLCCLIYWCQTIKDISSPNNSKGAFFPLFSMSLSIQCFISFQSTLWVVWRPEEKRSRKWQPSSFNELRIYWCKQWQSSWRRNKISNCTSIVLKPVLTNNRRWISAVPLPQRASEFQRNSPPLPFSVNGNDTAAARNCNFPAAKNGGV